MQYAMTMNLKQIGALRRAGIYFVVGYGGLAVINNSGIATDDVWITYLPLFIGVYFFARWADAKIASMSANKDRDK